ncbi:MAG: Uma2 family endonuclease [Tetrasphaera sp.]
MTTLPWGRELTADDLAALPDDGHRYELIDGALIVTPSPSAEHQAASMGLIGAVGAALPSHLRLLHAPLDVHYANCTVMQPDLLVVPREGFFDRAVPLRPVLAVEILSPSTRLIDLNLKKARYERAGCPSYWVIDPVELRLIAWDLVDAAYVEVADVTGEQSWTAAHPFPVTIVPARLLD